MGIMITRPFLQAIDRFLYSPAYFVLLGVLTVLSNVWGQEAFVYPCLIVLGVYICLFGRDLLPLMPIFACGYISPSTSNNPGVNEGSIFSFSQGGSGIYIAALGALLVGSMIYRLVKDPDFGGKKFLGKRRRLLSGMIILGISYAISGMCSGKWEEKGWENLLFAFIQFVAIAGLYYLLSGSVKWNQAPKEYLSWTGICVGYVLIAELVGIYITQDVLVEGKILRENIFTGWGHYNSMGALFAMLIPLPFFLTDKGCARTAFAYMTAFLFWVALLFTCSRGSIIVGTAVYAAGYVLSLACSRYARRQWWIHLISILIPIAAVAYFREELRELFRRIIELGMNPGTRDKIYMEGLKQFRKFPVFGGSFFPVDYYPYVWADRTAFTDLFPPRWHNTIVQLLATGGVTCLAAYAFHRIQTLLLFFKNASATKFFVGLSVAALLLTSIVDCHFFNVGPVLLYSSMLAFVEFRLEKEKK